MWSIMRTDSWRCEKMELEDQMKTDWSQYCQPPMEVDHSGEWSSNYMTPENNSEPCCNIWTDAEPARVKACNGHSFAMEARIRLDNLKSGCHSSSRCCITKRTLYNYDSEKDLWDSEDSALDMVDILDVEDDVHDEENWLYEPPKKFVGEKESALKWCRHVLDNPSPEMQAACHALLNKLDQRSRRHAYRQPAVFHQAASVSVGSSLDITTDSSTHSTSDHLDDEERSGSHDSITTSYRLKDITDVHIMAQIQEASLRQDYVTIPPSASSVRRPESPSMLPSCFNKAAENFDDFIATNRMRASSSPGFQSGPKSLSSSPCQSPTLPLKEGCQSPRLARLRQQVTQFKLLKLAQNQGASPDRRRSPLRTSLRSLQAVRNSRSLDTGDDCSPANHFTTPPSGASSTRMDSGGWPMPASPPSVNSGTSQHLKKDSSLRAAAIKKLQRSQSLSPRRIPHPAKGYLPAPGRVFASPERVTTAAWPRNLPSVHR